MKCRTITEAKDPDLRASLPALQRAAQEARRIAIQTGTGIVVQEGDQIVHLDALTLRRERQ